MAPSDWFISRLYGATNVQIYFYIRKYREDRTWLKCAVAFLWYVGSGHVEMVLEGAAG